MRRHEYEQFMKNSCIGLLADCAYYCWQEHQINGEELFLLDAYSKKIYESNKGGVLYD